MKGQSDNEIFGITDSLFTDSKAKSEITRIYRKLAKRYHPDKNQDDNAAEDFARINNAYQNLLVKVESYKIKPMQIPISQPKAYKQEPTSVPKNRRKQEKQEQKQDYSKYRPANHKPATGERYNSANKRQTKK
jgi:preprotein translocase subunit Sec63